MILDYSTLAADALDDYQDSDPDLYRAVDDVLELLENDDTNPILRRRLFRPPGAFVVRVYPSSPRSRPYYVFWAPEQNGSVAFIKYVGPADRPLW
ncbi:hypothetical protein [Microbacterium paludicola]|uniref:hypothetical protein n=1 Tax=Microbacterium paludicola TaxID=300019 RepID=UPI0009039B83|nr:hypothetical protein [Microbacterium paludicola]APF34913.1 hypothetical protein BO218_12550 [Microbacterium paludicola]